MQTWSIPRPVTGMSTGTMVDSGLAMGKIGPFATAHPREFESNHCRVGDDTSPAEV